MIRNIIFDLGGVLLNLDYQLTSSAFQKLGMRDFDAHYSQARQEGLFDDYEKGKISSAVFRDQLRRFLPESTSDDQIDEAWNAMLLDFPAERLQLLEAAKKKYRIFLLSNTNEIHIRAYSSILYHAHGFENLSHLFEQEYYSYHLGMRKPDAEIFEAVLQQNHLAPHETLFIDDSIQHVEGALRTGIDARWLKPGKKLTDRDSPVFSLL